MEDKEPEVEITHPDKVLFGESGVTKKQLADYYTAVFPYMFPHVDGRPISMERFPNGIHSQGFYQKEASDYFPKYIKQIRVKLKTDVRKCYVRVENAASIAYLSNQANIPIHTWLSKKGSLTKPDILIWDFDPIDGDFDKARECAFFAKELLLKIGIDPYVKTTGSKGLHIAQAIMPNQDFEKVKQFAENIALQLVDLHPDIMTTEMSKAKRGGKVFVDYLRNSYGATAVAPYSVRPKENAPVAMPITWQELKKKELRSDSFHIGNALPRLKKTGDIWADFFKKPIDLKEVISHES